MQEQISQLINRDKPVPVSEVPSEDQDNQKSLLKELIKLMRILTNDDEPPYSWAPSKISAIKSKRFPAPVRNNTSRIALWRYLRDHGEDMRKWHDQATPVLRARVKELQSRSITSAVAPLITGNE